MLCDETFSSEEPENVYDVSSSPGSSAIVLAAPVVTAAPVWTLTMSTMVLQDGEAFSDEDVPLPVVALPVDSTSHESVAKRMRYYKTRCCRLDSRCKKLREEVAALQEHIRSTDFSTRGAGGHVPLKSQMMVVLKKAALGYTNLELVGIWMQDQSLARSTVRRWEEKAATALLVESQALHDQGELLLRSQLEQTDGPGCCMNIAVHTWYADGTNTMVYGGCKLQVTCVQSEYSASGQSCGLHEVWPDALPITEGKGRGILDLVAKQFALIGCPFLGSDNTTELAGHAFRLVFGVTDAGGDIALTKRLINGIINLRQWEHHVGIDCQHHQASLGERRQLKFTDMLSARWKLQSTYFSTLVKWGYSFRSRRSALKLEWAKQFGQDAADRVTTKVVRVPCSTRWGSTGDCEMDTSRATPEEYKSVFAAITDKKNVKKKKKADNNGPYDELAIDNADVMAAKRNKWETELMAALVDDKFWVLKLVSYYCRQGWRHHQHYLHSSVLSTESHLMLLVCGKAASIQDDFTNCLVGTCSSWNAIQCAITAVLVGADPAPDFESEVYGGCVGPALRGWLDYKRRVLDVFCNPQLPFVLLWFARSRVDVDCHHRRRVADGILHHGEGGDLCGKLLRTHAMVECLRFSASTGTMVPGSALHTLVQMFVRHAKISTEHVEATNKIVKVEVKRAP